MQQHDTLTAKCTVGILCPSFLTPLVRLEHCMVPVLSLLDQARSRPWDLFIIVT